MIRDEVRVLEEVCEEARRLGSLTKEHRERLKRAFGKRFDNALEALEEGAVKKYVFEPSGRSVWIVVGRERDYQIIPLANYCSCDDFYFRVISGDAALCYHVIAQKLAEALGKYEVISESDEMYEPLMRDWRFVRREEFER